jgi:hypothetical protein
MPSLFSKTVILCLTAVGGGTGVMLVERREHRMAGRGVPSIG